MKIYRKFDLYILLFAFVIAISVFIFTNKTANEKIELVKAQKYNIYSKNVQDEISILIKNKKELTLSIALALSKDQSIVNALKQKDINKLKLKEFSYELKEKTRLKNVWFHIVDNKGNSFYRSWVKKRGDSLLKARMDIAKMIEEPKTMCTISTGKFDMTFKSMVPIYDGKKFLGLFEIITHFNSISAQLLENSIDSVIVVDKTYKKQLTKALTKTFIDDYYIANLNAKEYFLEYLKDNNISRFFNQEKSYKVDEVNNHFITFYNVNDIYGKPMGTIVSFKDLDSLNMEDIQQIKSNLVFYIILTLLMIFLIAYFLISKKHSRELDEKVKIRTEELNKEKNYIQAILHTNPSIILVTRDSQIVHANDRFLEFFEYETLDDFKNDYDCICDLFLTLDNEAFNRDKKIEGKTWADYLANNTHTDHFVELEYQDEEYDFTVNAAYLQNNGDILLTFKNITELKNKDKLLYEQSKMASMGEMIANIAHQWRQPLSVISTAATGMSMQKELGVLKDKEFEAYCESINDNAQYLSQTIDDFRNFIKGDKQKEEFILNKELEKLYHLIKPSIVSHRIELITNIDKNIKMEGYSSELLQCLINIYNNAKDALIQYSENERYILLDAKQIDNEIHITIQDSAGGIDEDIITKIFDPYFTTKHKSLGTGLGLHMTYNLIVDSMNGTIQASNKEFVLKGKTYKGALFEIVIPVE